MNTNIISPESATPPPGAHHSYVLQDLELASTFIGRSKAGPSAQQDYELARRAYDSVAQYVMHAALTRQEHADIAHRMRELAKALHEFERRSAC